VTSARFVRRTPGTARLDPFGTTLNEVLSRWAPIPAKTLRHGGALPLGSFQRTRSLCTKTRSGGIPCQFDAQTIPYSRGGKKPSVLGTPFANGPVPKAREKLVLVTPPPKSRLSQRRRRPSLGFRSNHRLKSEKNAKNLKWAAPKRTWLDIRPWSRAKTGDTIPADSSDDLAAVGGR